MQGTTTGHSADGDDKDAATRTAPDPARELNNMNGVLEEGTIYFMYRCYVPRMRYPLFCQPDLSMSNSLLF